MYYAWAHVGDRGQAWYGRIDRLGAAGSQEFFLDPIGLVDVLGVLPLPAQPGQLPAVALTMSPGELVDGPRVERTPCSYVLTCIDRARARAA